ncbi:MAG TPA: ATPase, T2SS/T4P/T4SS family, partial [Vineibacter sp.]|nr:ATPase, T2SS/T4P/T4SS family [Vineibacter sp.]
ELFGLGPLEAAMQDETVAAIFVNGLDSVFVDRRGRLEPARVTFSDIGQLDRVVGRLAERAGVALTGDRDPLIDRRLDDGTRVIIATPPLAPAGPYIAITRPVTRTVTLDSLVAENALSPQMASVLRLAVRSRLNLLVCGAPGTGKTALLAALARVAAGENRIITIERAAELQLNLPHHVPLIVEGGTGTAPASAFTAALALRPDRLLIDNTTEAVVSGITNAVWMGVDGIIASFGATTPQEALERLEAQLRSAEPALPSTEVHRRLARSFELVVHLGRQHDGVRRAQHLADVAVEGDSLACRDLFTFDPAAGRFVSTALRPSFLPRVARAGLERALLDAL